VALFLKKGGKILKVHSGYVFKKQDYVFSKFIDEFSALKNSKRGYAAFGKLIINSLYGKFGAFRQNLNTIVFDNREDFENFSKLGGTTRCGQIGLFWVVEYDKQFVSRTGRIEIKDGGRPNVIYASIITSKARIKLYQMFDKITSSGHLSLIHI
jgi:hypothetical protein